MTKINQIKIYINSILRKASETSWMLFKIMIPILIVTKVLKDFGIIEILGKGLAPVMQLVGLPGSMALVWATGMITNLYGAMLVFVSIGSDMALTTAQVTVLSTMLLVAHALPIELRIVQKAGPRMRWMVLIRLVGALCLGIILNWILTSGQFLQGENVLLWNPTVSSVGWLGWAIGEIKNLITIFVIITLLLLLMSFLEWSGAIRLLNRILSPGLKILGIGQEATHLTMIGMTLGLGYGGGLLVSEVQKGHVPPRDVFLSLVLMSLCHSLIEDTLLMTALGAHIVVLFFSRFLFAVLVTYCFSLIIKRLSCEKFFSYWHRKQAK